MNGPPPNPAELRLALTYSDANLARLLSDVQYYAERLEFTRQQHFRELSYNTATRAKLAAAEQPQPTTEDR